MKYFCNEYIIKYLHITSPNYYHDNDGIERLFLINAVTTSNLFGLTQYFINVRFYLKPFPFKKLTIGHKNVIVQPGDIHRTNSDRSSYLVSWNLSLLRENHPKFHKVPFCKTTLQEIVKETLKSDQNVHVSTVSKFSARAVAYRENYLRINSVYEGKELQNLIS